MGAVPKTVCPHPGCGPPHNGSLNYPLRREVMSGNEDPSWLSSVIERVDQLALTIGGYGEKTREHGFSDDESDTSDEDSASVDSGFEDALDENGGGDDGDDDDDEDSGFEDAVASPVRFLADRQLKVASRAHAESPPSSDLLKRKGRRLARADEFASLSVERQQSNPERVNTGDTEGPEGEDYRPSSQEARQKLVPERAEQTTDVSNISSCIGSGFADDNMLDSEEAIPVQQRIGGSSPTPVFGTPSHSRDRSTYARGPPVPASVAGSRRVHRERNRTSESPATSSCEVTHGAAEAASVYSSSSWSASRPSNTANGLPPGRAKKRYSHVSDTTWLKRKEDSPETTPSPPKLGLELATVVSVASRCTPIRRSARSTGEEEFPAATCTVPPSCAVPPVDTAGLDPASSSAEGRNRHRFPAEGGRHLRQDVLKGSAQDSQVEKPSLPECVEDPQVDERGVADGEDVADETILSRTKESHVPSDVLNVDITGEQVETNGQHGPNEENGEKEARRVGMTQGEGNGNDTEKDGALQDDLSEDSEEVSGHWNERGATVGAKRAQNESSMGAHESDWFLDSPEGFAPSKRGKTHPRYPLAVMRHSARLDDAIHERQRKLGAMAASSGSSENVAEKVEKHASKGVETDVDDVAAVPWPDRSQRPYDSPIVDTDLPARQAKELCRLGMDSRTLIVCSPFRRCLQTAGIVARTLGVAGITVHLGIGERMDKVRKEIAELALANKEASERASGSRQPAPVFSYLEEADMRGELGAGVRLQQIVGEQPPEGESGVEAKQRFIATIAEVREEQLCDHPVLVVAHGDTLDAAGESLASQIVFEADYCAWALFDLDTHCGYVTESYGIQMIPL